MIEIIIEETKEKNKKEITLLEYLKDNGVNIKNLCGGKGICGKCKIKIKEGTENLSQLTAQEKKILTENELKKGIRLSCQAKIKKTPITLNVPKKSLREKESILTKGSKISYKKNPLIKKYPVTLFPASLENATADSERIFNSLKKHYGLKIKEVDYLCLKNLPEKIRNKENLNSKKIRTLVNPVIWGKKELIDVQEKPDGNLMGLAIDLGTTTIVVYLIDLETGETESISSLLNPQISFGEDIMTRISFALENQEGLKKLRQTVQDEINKVIEKILEKNNLAKEDILEVVMVGNTAMHHLFLELNPKYLALSPYTPVIQSSKKIKSREIDMQINKAGYIHWLPVNAGWVGPDHIAVLLASKILERSEKTLIIDLGTNGEIALGNKERCLTTSTAAGPAFEGGQIKHGTRAEKGSINKVKIQPDTLKPIYRTIGNKKPTGICGSGIIDAVAQMFRHGIIKKTGTFNKKLTKNEFITKTDQGYSYILVPEKNSAIKSEITITQKDVIELLKAKGAIQAGTRVLMEKNGTTEKEIDKIFLAGAFGNYINKKSALTLGLVPEKKLEKIRSIGNAAGEGCKLALLSKEKRKEAEKIAKFAEFIELAGTKEFSTNYTRSLFIPHKDLSLYPNLAKKLKLKNPKSGKK